LKDFFWVSFRGFFEDYIFAWWNKYLSFHNSNSFAFLRLLFSANGKGHSVIDAHLFSLVSKGHNNNKRESFYLAHQISINLFHWFQRENEKETPNFPTNFWLFIYYIMGFDGFLCIHEVPYIHDWCKTDKTLIARECNNNKKKKIGRK
jgi:hypothetical protein